jgi:hypothetical protein
MAILAFWFSDDYECVPVSLRASKYVCLYTTYSLISKNLPSNKVGPSGLVSWRLSQRETEISKYPRIVVFPSP